MASLSLDELMQVEVSAPGKFPEPIRDTPASVYLVSRQDIAQFGYGSLTDALENVPGLYNLDNYDGVSGNFGFRGFWNPRSQNSNVAILLNGIPQTRMDLRSHPMESLGIPIEAIDKIEVARGPNSVVYGNGAAFGAINIITDESYHDNHVSASFGSGDTSRVSARWSAYGAESHVIVNAGASRTDGPGYLLSELMSPEAQEQLPNYNVFDPEISLDGRQEQESRFAQVSGMWKDFYIDYTLNDYALEFFSGVPAVDDGNQRDGRTSRLTVGYSGEIAPSLRWDGWASHNEVDIEQDYDALYPGLESDYFLKYTSWEGESLLTYQPDEDLRLTLGANWQQMNDLHEYTHIPDFGVNNEVVKIRRRDTYSIFGEASYRISPEWRVVGGLRSERVPGYQRSIFDNIVADPAPSFVREQGRVRNLTPRGALIYQPSQAHVFKLIAGDATKMPVNREMEFASERLSSVELLYLYSVEGLFISTSVFLNSLSNLLVDELRFRPDGTVFTSLRASGEVETAGVDFLARRSFGENWSAELGGTYQNSDDKSHPNGLASYSPRLTLHGKLRYQQGDFSVAALGRYVGSLRSYFDKVAENEDETFGAFWGESAGGYAVFDLNLRWENVVGGLYANVKLSNLLDRTIRYPSSPINTGLLDLGTLGSGRRAQVTMGYRF